MVQSARALASQDAVRCRSSTQNAEAVRRQSSAVGQWLLQQLDQIAERHGSVGDQVRRVLPSGYEFAPLRGLLKLEPKVPNVSRALFYQVLQHVRTANAIVIRPNKGQQPKCDLCTAFHSALLSARAVGDEVRANLLLTAHGAHVDFIARERALMKAISLAPEAAWVALTDRPSNPTIPHAAAGQLSKSEAHLSRVICAVQGFMVCEPVTAGVGGAVGYSTLLYVQPKTGPMGANFTAQAILDTLLLSPFGIPFGLVNLSDSAPGVSAASRSTLSSRAAAFPDACSTLSAGGVASAASRSTLSVSGAALVDAHSGSVPGGNASALSRYTSSSGAAASNPVVSVSLSASTDPGSADSAAASPLSEPVVQDAVVLSSLYVSARRRLGVIIMDNTVSQNKAKTTLLALAAALRTGRARVDVLLVIYQIEVRSMLSDSFSFRFCPNLLKNFALRQI